MHVTSPTMDAEGYGIRVSLDDVALTVEGKNKLARVALAGEEHDRGPVVVPRSEIAAVEWKGASALVNGHLRVLTTSGRKYDLHFRKKQQEGLAPIARALGAA